MEGPASHLEWNFHDIRLHWKYGEEGKHYLHLDPGKETSTVNNGKKIQYFYDHTGRRARKTVDGVTTDFRMAGELLMSQKAGDVTTYFSYDSAGNLIGMSAGRERYFYTRNAQNDITAD